VEPLPSRWLERPTGKAKGKANRSKKLKIHSKRKLSKYGKESNGPKKIVDNLNLKGFTIDHHQVYRVICEASLNHPVTEPRKTWEPKRFQREH